MTTPTGIRAELIQLRRLAAAVTAYGGIHQDQAQHRGDDDGEEAWLWIGTTGRMLNRHLDQLEQHLAKVGIIARPEAHDEP